MCPISLLILVGLTARDFSGKFIGHLEEQLHEGEKRNLFVSGFKVFGGTVSVEDNIV
jgi:hypothetical protein